jgi:hypothetical protein
MRETELDLSHFEKDSEFYPPLDLVLTVKSFDLQAIRKRYIESRKNTSGKAGSVERRAVSKGGVAKVRLENGHLREIHTVSNLSEPRGIDYKDKRLAISLENKVYVFTESNFITLENPWFSYIHTVDFHPKDLNRILVTSSGYECIMEYNFLTKEKLWDWFAWDHGLNQAVDPKTNETFLLTKDEAQADRYADNNQAHLLINRPKDQDLPTAKRAAFINTARYDSHNPENIFVTLFHEGTVRSLEKTSGNHSVVLDAMKSPHGGHRLNEQQIMATNTAGGTVELQYGEERIHLLFKNIPGKPEELEETEWLQNSIHLESYIITIDSNRNALVIIDLEKRKYDTVPYNQDWAVQDMIAYDNENEPLVDKGLELLTQIKQSNE